MFRRFLNWLRGLRKPERIAAPSRDTIASQVLDGLKGLPSTGAKLFVRLKDFQIVGLLLKKETKMDVASGEMRIWGWIKDLNWRDVDEPLDRRTAKGVESCVVFESGMVLVTARNAPGTENGDDSFTWLTAPRPPTADHVIAKYFPKKPKKEPNKELTRKPKKKIVAKPTEKPKKRANHER